ncbi:uncharacterized protein BDZ99DRAFT_457460 [Mytilinidion resinicola]|uniref:Azaphilone pigments biosynthesis cluster protein L N-terminal domain-containing protein n=1 Tax=Mytilinidion resinicola TaxID=574789 RepID=A0A6A6Z9N7_9PEZI|nr:uncharacterized protein BDZ99DRAFT_457460 [Mytilinidion resinicola]KAF2817726.1 hypothetical protein BDZ99DRAFT_457460 [Mytilinidion resinicola]
MDPVGIAGTAAGLATAAVRASLAIHSLIESTTRSDTTIAAFESELSNISNVLASLGTAFTRPNIGQLY